MSFNRSAWIGAAIAAPILLVSCANPPAAPAVPGAKPPPAPFYVDAGLGSEHGNFIAVQDGERTGPGGVHCVTYAWDRPLTAQRLGGNACGVINQRGGYAALEGEGRVTPGPPRMLTGGIRVREGVWERV